MVGKEGQSEVKLIIEPDDGIAPVLRALAKAKKFIDIMIFRFDRVEVEKALKAGQATSVTLTGKEPGVYEVETHEPELRLLKIAVR